MHFNDPSDSPLSLSTARLQKAPSVIRGAGNCPHVYYGIKLMFWLLLSKLLRVSEGFFKAGENYIGQLTI